MKKILAYLNNTITALSEKLFTYLINPTTTMLERFFNFLNNLPRDKKDHALFGLISYSFISLYSPLIAIIVVTIQGISKEIYDGTKTNHTRDIWDAVATIAIPFILYVLWIVKGLLCGLQ